MIRCPKCDHFNLEGETRCERCEAPLPVEPDAAASAPPPPQPTPQEAELLAIFAGQGKIAAIKHYRLANGADLKTSQEAVERLLHRHQLGSNRAGCAGVVLLLVAAAHVWHRLG